MNSFLQNLFSYFRNKYSDKHLVLVCVENVKEDFSGYEIIGYVLYEADFYPISGVNFVRIIAEGFRKLTAYIDNSKTR